MLQVRLTVIVLTDVLSSQPTNFLLASLFKKGMWRTTILLWIIWLTSTAYYFGTFLLATSLFRFHEHCSELHTMCTLELPGHVCVTVRITLPLRFNCPPPTHHLTNVYTY